MWQVCTAGVESFQIYCNPAITKFKFLSNKNQVYPQQTRIGCILRAISSYTFQNYNKWNCYGHFSIDNRYVLKYKKDVISSTNFNIYHNLAKFWSNGPAHSDTSSKSKWVHFPSRNALFWNWSLPWRIKLPFWHIGYPFYTYPWFNTSWTSTTLPYNVIQIGNTNAKNSFYFRNTKYWYILWWTDFQ